MSYLWKEASIDPEGGSLERVGFELVEVLGQWCIWKGGEASVPSVPCPMLLRLAVPE